VADEALTAGAVARRLGVAVTTLRTWHQRYGLGPSLHTPGQHRRYTPEDMDRLQVMRRLTEQGVAPAEAAAWARRAPLPMPVSIDPHARDGGGTAIATGRAGPAARGLARAAMRLDAGSMREMLETIITDRGVIGAWNEVIMPVLIGIGERYEATKRFVEVEHLASRTITEVLGSVPRPPSTRSPQLLLAAADEEYHTLPLEALAAALAEAGVPSRLFGARVPPDALREAIARTGPAAVVIWSQTSRTGDVEQLRRLLIGPQRPLLVAAAGPGWSAADLPGEVVLLGSLPEAVRVLSAADAGLKDIS
jgi:MerR family transcriptional regulator, light-induced transcriptional regulator